MGRDFRLEVRGRNYVTVQIKYAMSQTQILGSNAEEIAASVERAVEAGALASGARLPTIRALAGTLKVSPVTVAAAYRALQSRGLVEGSGRRGTLVRQPLHHPPALTHTRAAAVREADGLIDLATGNPDPDLLPPIGPHLHGLSHTTHLYGDPLAFRPLVAFAASEFEVDGIPAGHVVIASGSLDAIERVLREHVRPGGRVVVEDPTLPSLLALIASLGLTSHPAAIDDEGPQPEALERALRGPAGAVILSPRAQNPTGAAITSRRASDLARILHRHPRTLLVEIDSAGPVSGAPAVTLIDPARQHWAVVRSTSKFLGPDLRVAAIACDALTAGRVLRRQALGVRWVSHLLQALTLSLWSDPSSGRRLARAADVYRQRRVSFIDALALHGIRSQGRSGLHVWVPVREESATVSGLAARGWSVAAGERFRLRSAPAIRITTSALAPDEGQRLAADLAAVLHPSAVTSA